MNSDLKKQPLPILMAGLGAISLLLRVGLYLFSKDGRGLLITSHPLNILVWVVTAAAALAAILSVGKLDGSRRYADNFGPSNSAALGSFALAVGISATLLTSGFSALRLEQIRNLVGLLAVPSLIRIGLCRRQGKRPFFAFHALVCLYLTLHAVSHYQAWCSRPQLQDYFFSVMGCILLTLFAYYQTAFDVGLGKRRMQLATGLLAGFVCIAALAGGQDMLLYGTGALWALTGLCRLTPVPRKKKAPNAEAPKEDSHDPA